MIDREAEYKLLGSFVDYPEALNKATDLLFTQERTSIYEAMKLCFLRWGTITTEGTKTFYGGNPIPGQVEASRGHHPDALIEYLAELALRREAELVKQRMDDLLRGTRPIAAADIAQASIIRPVLSSLDTTLDPGIQEMLTDLMQKKNGTYQFLRTGLQFLDTFMGGEWAPQEISILAAEAGTGKTAFFLNTMYCMATLEVPQASLFVSLEMGRKYLVQRMVAKMLGIDGMRIREGRLTDEEVLRVRDATNLLRRLPIFIEERPGLDIADILTLAEHHVTHLGVRWIGIDYVQIVGHRKGSAQRNEMLGDIGRLCKEFVKRHNVHISLISQLSRSTEAGIKNRVRGSGELVEAADTVIGMTPGDGPMHAFPIVFSFDKNRNGRTGAVTVEFNKPFQAFSQHGRDERATAAAHINYGDDEE